MPKSDNGNADVVPSPSGRRVAVRRGTIDATTPSGNIITTNASTNVIWTNKSEHIDDMFSSRMEEDPLTDEEMDPNVKRGSLTVDSAHLGGSSFLLSNGRPTMTQEEAEAFCYRKVTDNWRSAAAHVNLPDLSRMYVSI